MNFQTIPLDRLDPSPLNVRKTAGVSIAQLASNICAVNLLHNLVVRAVGDRFEVIDGHRRLAALRQLQREQLLADDYGAPCSIVAFDSDTGATEASLSANTMREAMHAADQCDAFKALLENGNSEADVSAHFGVTIQYLRQRMKLANVSPKIIEAFRAGKIKLHQVEAYALSDDHPRQERVLKSLGPDADARWIRQELTKGDIAATDKRVRFVGLDAYEAAGGPVRRDMFEKDEAYIADAKLLDRLVAEKLEAEAKKLRADGWSFVEAGVAIDTYSFRKLEGRPDKAAAGALVTLAWNGQLEVVRNVLKPGKKMPQGAAAKGNGAKATEPDKKSGALSFPQVQQLQAVRTVVLRHHLAGSVRLAKAALAAKLSEGLRSAEYSTGDDAVDGMVRISASHNDRMPGNLADQVSGLPATKALEEQTKAVLASMPKKGRVFAWLLEQPEATTDALLALCAGRAVLALDTYAGRKDAGREFATLAGIDFTKHWKVSGEWLQAQPTAYLVAAVTEACGKPAGEALAREKGKAAVVAKAAEVLAGASPAWLPLPLRALSTKPAPASAAPAAKKAKPSVAKAVAKKATAKPAKKKPSAKKPAKKAPAKRKGGGK